MLRNATIIIVKQNNSKYWIKIFIHIEKQQTRLDWNHNAGEEAMSVHIMHPFVVVVVAVDLTCFEAIIKREKNSRWCWDLVITTSANIICNLCKRNAGHNFIFMDVRYMEHVMLYSLPISSALIRTMITSINAVSKKKKEEKNGIKPDPRVVETLLPMRNGYKSMLTTIGQETIAISVPLLLIRSIRFYGSCWKISICYTIAC